GDGAAAASDPAPGLATPENIEGTPADEAHDSAPGAPPEGSPEDQLLDAAAAGAVNNGSAPPTSVEEAMQGASSTEPPTPASAPAASQLPAGDQQPVSGQDAAAIAAGGSAGEQTIERLFTVPIRVSVKVGEADSDTAFASAT